ncbi:MAG: hypothetical protein ACLS29_09850, partial [Prevotellamassilia sp.]
GSYEIKRVGLLADVLPEDLHPKDEGGEVTDTLLPALAAIQKVREAQPQAAVPSKPAPKGLVCIEDYADANQRGMFPFYQALAQRKQLNRPVRIAYFGDSFIEVDILTGALTCYRKLAAMGSGFWTSLLPMLPTEAPCTNVTADGMPSAFSTGQVPGSSTEHRSALLRATKYGLDGNQQGTPTPTGTTVHTLYLRANAPLR